MKSVFYTLLLVVFAGQITVAQTWETNLESAQALATKENKPIILVFKGSDWCAPCIKLDKEIFTTETFQQYAKKHFVLLEADFPKRKKNALAPTLQSANDALAERYNKRGIFPFVVLLNAKGDVMGETGYFKTTPKGYIKHLEQKMKDI